MSTPEFKPWGKTPRWSGGVAGTITEKLDGTNALICITAEGELFAGSRNRWLSPGGSADNYGFAEWCAANRDELMKLGVGYHYGEWWGEGIGRRYGLAEKRLSLFNTRRFGPHNPNTPACCSVVPVLYEGLVDSEKAKAVLIGLQVGGSVAAPGFMRPEGVIIYLHQTDQRFKFLAENHDKHKFQVEAP